MHSNSSRPALLPIDHPLCYSRRRTQPDLLRDGAWTGKSSEHQGTGQDKIASMLQKVIDRQDIINLLNEYAYILDTVMVDVNAVKKWADLFTSDCSVTYPFGNFLGKDSLSPMCIAAETRFERMVHMSSNCSITFESDTVAHGRSTLFAICGLDPNDIGKNFAEGGYYYWSFRKENTAEGGTLWKISYLNLDVTWTQGESLGLNQPLEVPAATKEFVHSEVNEVKVPVS